MGGIGPDQLDDVDAAALQPDDRALRRRRAPSLTGCGVGQQGDSLQCACHGISLPGLRIPPGSSTFLTARSTSTPRSPTSAVIHGL
ncbi:Uncharacterised protein [Mycobacteroides abscessus subsp. abscessus]|nr:Uncharacterised protein [Mycobacteroides abscessus subsp. abscessus]